ncbi:MAG: hypothetical protein AAF950_04370 [Pseudomonadota bacterium]
MKNLVAIGLLSGVLAACATTPSSGSTELTPLLVANQPGDSDMTCEDISAELDRMSVMIAEANQGAVNAENSGAAAGAAGNVAVNAALYSGALGRVPGLGIAANAASGMAQRQAQAEAERQAENARRAELRQTTLTGIAAGKGC